MGLRSQPFTIISIGVVIGLAYLWVAATFGFPFGKFAFWLFAPTDRKSTRLNSSHSQISYAVFCLKKKNDNPHTDTRARRRSSSSPAFSPPKSRSRSAVRAPYSDE